MSSPSLPVTVTYSQPCWRPEWAVPEVPVPESNWHDLGIEYLRSLLRAWAEREGRKLTVARNLGIRWHQPEPRAGFDPDLCLLEPAPPDQPLSSLRLWERDHAAPWLAIEIVSPGHPYKDYLDTPARAGAAGIGELWVFDPLLCGPRSSGGPFALQIWTREEQVMTRSHAGNAPGYSPSLDAWLVPELQRVSKRPSRALQAALEKTSLQTLQSAPAESPADRAAQISFPRLAIYTAEVGGTTWPTLEEVAAERVNTEAERANAEAERADRAAQRAALAERRLEVLERRLAKTERSIEEPE